MSATTTERNMATCGSRCVKGTLRSLRFVVLTCNIDVSNHVPCHTSTVFTRPSTTIVPGPCCAHRGQLDVPRYQLTTYGGRWFICATTT